MNLQALEVFCEVVRKRSFSRGAAEIGISQSAASQLIAHLEDEIGFLLIDRSHRPLEPTKEGELYFAGCQRILYDHRTLLDEISRHQQALADTVRVASIYSTGLHTLNHYIQRFMTEHPNATIKLEYFLPAKVYEAVLNDEADIGVISYPAPHRQLEIVPWLEEHMVLACPPGHRLTSRPTLRIRDLDGETFVAFDRELRIRREIDRLLRSRHVTLRILSEFDNIETIKQALEISRAVSILPRASIEREVQRGTLVEIPFERDELVRPVGLIHKRRKNLTRTAQLFIASLVDGPAPSLIQT